MSGLGKLGIITKVLVLLILVSIPACSSDNDGDDEKVTIAGPATGAPAELVTITIGNLSDLTGPSSNAMEVINMALDDVVEYFNDNGLIPGVELKVVTYDGQLDPSRDLPGYEWLLERGADLIYTGQPVSPVALKARVNDDKVVLFTPSVCVEELYPSGYIFNVGAVPAYDAYTILKWIAENDWDYQANRPAKVGGAGWTDSYTDGFFKAAEEYADAHPDQFEWIGGHLTPFTFAWSAEVEALKDADYVVPVTIPMTLVKEYRSAGHDAKFIMADTHAAFVGMMDAADIWDQIDGSLFVRASRWWTEQGQMIDLTNQILDDNHSPSEAESIRRMGSGYLAIGSSLYIMLDVIRHAVENVGLQNFNSQTLYETAQSYSMTIDGIERFNFTNTKRHSNNHVLIYKASEAERDLVRVSEDWVPLQLNP